LAAPVEVLPSFALPCGHQFLFSRFRRMNGIR